MTSIFEVLYCRRPVLNYVCPPVCEVLFSGSGFPVIVLGDFSSLAAPGGVRFGGSGGFRLSWNNYPGAICYNVYRAETDDPDAPLVLVFECYPGTDIPLPPGCYRVSAITPDGETALSPPVCYFVPPMLPPEVTTNAASDISITQATLNGIINAVGQASTAYFEWGTTLAYGSTTPIQNIGATFADVPYNAIISGLAVNTLYHFRAIGFNGSGEGDGADLTFTTSSAGGFNWDLAWSIFRPEQLGPGGSVSQTLSPDTFDLAASQGPSVVPGDETHKGWRGDMNYTGPATDVHLHLVVSNASNVNVADIFVEVDGNNIFQVPYPDYATNGTYDYDFTIPVSINSSVVVFLDVTLFIYGQPSSGRWVGTLTPS